MQLQAGGGPLGQGVVDQRRDGLGERQRVRGGGRQRLGQLAGVGSEQVQRNRLRSQVGADVQQLHRGRVLTADAFQADVPQGGDRVRAGGDLAPRMQVGGAAAQQVQVFPGWHPGAVQVRCGLLQRQRQLPEFQGDLLPGLLAEIRDAGTQQAHRIRQIDHLQVHHRPQGGEPAAPGRDNHVAGNPGRQRHRRQPRLDVLSRVGVVEDQQPSRHTTQRVTDLITQRLGVRDRLQAQPRSQGSELVG